MKKIYKSRLTMALVLLIASFSAYAQIPNAGFENWTGGSCNLGFTTYNDPNSWGSINSLTCPGSGFTCLQASGANAHSGSYALELTTVSIFGQVAPGIIATGKINQTTQNVDGGFALSTRPDKLIGWYKYIPSNPDTFSVNVDIFSGATTGAVIGTGTVSGYSTVNSYTKFIIDINYTSGVTPDSAKITILSSPGQNGTPGTKMYVDDLAFVSCSGFTAPPTTVNASCNTATGSITLGNPVNGTAPYAYAWSTGSTATTVSNLVPGTYKVTITDDNRCVSVDSIVVGAANSPFTVTVTGSSTSCISNNGTVTAAASAGHSPYTYLWANNSTATQLTNLGPGNYSVTVTDANGCTTSAGGTVTTPNGPSGTSTVTNLLCYNDSTGAVNVTVTGGTGTITYAWSNASSSANISNLGAGDYTLTITDANNCSFEVMATVTQPTALLATGTSTSVSCYGDATGTVSVTASGGTTPYSYSWTGGATSSSLSNLGAGTYIAVVTDSNNCVTTDTLSILQPTAVTVTITTTDASSASASDGTATATGNGGTGTLTYLWNTGSSHADITHLSPDQYCVTVTDANFCTVSSCDSVGFSVGINGIPSLFVKVYPNPASNQLTIETGNTEGKFQLTIYSLDGRMVEQKTIAGEKTVLWVNKFAEGFYTYQLKDVVTGNINYGKLEIER